MSEYQYYEFTAVDRPLTGRERVELRSLSTRADITATSFVNTYEWGNFKGDPRTLMERYFDAHLYLANWGTRQLMLRLPKHVLDPATVAQYCQGDSASTWTAGGHVIIDLHDEGEDGADEWDLDGHGLLASIIPVWAGLAAGDLRLLYLAWLRYVQSEEIADDEPERPIPAGLGTLDAPLTAVAEFLRIDPDLIAAAAAGSSPAASGELTAAQLRTWDSTTQEIYRKKVANSWRIIPRRPDVKTRAARAWRTIAVPCPGELDAEPKQPGPDYRSLPG
ncbi:hypothetical protein ABZ541_14250 [Micromonospora sediminicola]|uniref:hypothetical protein n=1 Tax=Micromonospora sediminicola TaxID=946078 RepID=UPI0033C6248A